MPVEGRLPVSERAPAVLLLDHGHRDAHDYARGIRARGWRLEAISERDDLGERLVASRPDIVIVLSAAMSSEQEVALGVRIKRFPHMKVRPVLVVVEHTARGFEAAGAATADVERSAGAVDGVLRIAEHAPLSSWKRAGAAGDLRPAPS